MVRNNIRGGRRPIPKAEQDEILRLYVEEGLQPSEIARDTGRDARTVRKYLASAEADRVLREARVQLYRDALMEHHRDLVGLATRIKQSVNLPDRLLSPVMDPTTTVSQETLFEGFEQHLGRSPVWRDLGSWNNMAARWTTLGPPLWEFFASALMKMGLGAKAEVPEETGWLPGLKELVSDVAMREIKGEAPTWPPLVPYEIKEPYTGHVLISIGEFDILELPEGDHHPLLDALNKAWEQLKGSDESVELKGEVWRGLEKVRHDLRRELDILILRRVFPGNCRMCPR